jgi:hypothetical protein
MSAPQPHDPGGDIYALLQDKSKHNSNREKSPPLGKDLLCVTWGEPR